MALDPALKANSEMLQVKTKASVVAGNILKYEFGSYRVISSKMDWGSSTTGSTMFGNLETMESGQKSSFKMTVNETDTISANLSLHVQSDYVWSKYWHIKNSALSYQEEADLKSTTKNLLAIISLPSDTTAWNMVYVSRMNPDSSILVKKYGSLFNDQITIEIGEVVDWENQKAGKWALTKGFEFYEDGVAIAAVQSPQDTFKKKLVWMHNGLDEKKKKILATAIVVLMSYTTYYAN